MKSTGVVRKIDELGRLVLPVKLRRTLDLNENDALDISVEGQSIILKKYEPACTFCDNANNLVSFKGKNICPKCLEALQFQNS